MSTRNSGWMCIPRLFLVPAVFVGLGDVTWSQCDDFLDVTKLVGSDSVWGDDFGQSVAMDGDVIVVGAPMDDAWAEYSGSAHVFRYDGTQWLEEQKLLPSYGQLADFFGWSVAISGDVIVVGALGVDDLGDRSGSVYVFRYDGSGWDEEQQLWASDGTSFDSFGYSVAVSGDVIVVGMSLDDDRGSGSGSAYVFRYDGSQWLEEQKLLASDGSTLDHFGFDVAVSGDVIVAGADGDDDLGSWSGSAYVFRYDGSRWLEEQKLLASDGEAGDYFGRSLSGSGDLVVVGAESGNGVTVDSGSAYVFRYDGSRWLEEQKLLASDGEAGDEFGSAVALSGDAIVVGASGDQWPSNGTAYVFRYDGTGWQEEQQLVPSDIAKQFGRSIAVSGDVIVSGSADDVVGIFSGAAYVYHHHRSSWEESLTASDGVAGDMLGWSVAVDGDVALVGAAYGDGMQSDSGTAYLYRYDGSQWFEEQELVASAGQSHDVFGRSVSLRGDLAVVGATGADGLLVNAGATFVFRHDGSQWLEEHKLTASDGEPHDSFGYAVSVFGDVVVVGAPSDGDLGPDSGAAYVYRYVDASTRWVEEQKLLASDGVTSDEFGWAVAVSGDVAAVAALHHDFRRSDKGAVYLFRYDGTSWQEEQELQASDGAYLDRFGHSVSLDGDVVVVGAPSEDEGGQNAGAAYVFRYVRHIDGTTEWVEEQKLVPGVLEPFDGFGTSVAVSGDVMVVGTSGDDDAAINAGAGYVFRYDGQQWVEVRKIVPAGARQDDWAGRSAAVSGELVLLGAHFSDPGGMSNAGAAFLCVAPPELQLAVRPDPPQAGADVAFDTFYGQPNGAALLMFLEVDGRPVSWKFLGRFAADNHWILHGKVPPYLAGVSLTLKSYGVSPCQEIAETSLVKVTFQ